MIEIIIPLEPVAWAAHRGYGKKSFNPRYKEREAYQYYIRSQYKGKPLQGPILLSYWYHFTIPKSYSKKKRELIDLRDNAHCVKPDLDNLNKFTSDCLKGIVFEDDNQVFALHASKYYADECKVKIHIYNWNL